MNVFDEIKSARRYGKVRCGTSSQASPSPSTLAAEFGLDPAPGNYHDIDSDAARRLVTLVLHRDLAYRSEMIPAERAADLAGRLLGYFGAEGVRYFTNGDFHDARARTGAGVGASWNPVTGATFDTRVLVIGPRASGCLWVEDED